MSLDDDVIAIDGHKIHRDHLERSVLASPKRWVVSSEWSLVI